MTAERKTWCDEDEHIRFEYFSDFNEWFDSEEGQPRREEFNVVGLSQPSKAFYAGDKEAYDQAFREYRDDRRHEHLNEQYIHNQFGDDHWFERNLGRFDQFVSRLAADEVVPFIGAGLSKSGGFPTWKDHLRQQGRTAGIAPEHIDGLLRDGQYEQVIEEIEAGLSRDVFVQEIRDVFSLTGTITDVNFLIAELFKDTVVTTNYDRLIEQSYETGETDPSQIITGSNALEAPDPVKVTVIKLHGDIRTPTECILSRNQYDVAYGAGAIDVSLPIPKLLEYYYKNSSLLFLGCSLNSDRTIEVFRAIKGSLGGAPMPQHFAIEQAPESEEEMVARNAYLLTLGITAIWFEPGRFDCVEGMLRLARNELRYRDAT